ncbi:MAG: penicillin-binding protein activator [Rhodospirillales bacterium]|nr:penicillin-binding protein activator [Rhodospirillales bacterium]
MALVSCAGQAPQIPGSSGLPASLTPGGVASSSGFGKTSGNVLLLVPLSGRLAPVGQVLANAAKLAFPPGSMPGLDIRDTGGTPAGAVSAAQAGLAAGDGIILGPLTAGETQAVAPVAQQAGVNVLAFTNDSAVSAPGVWALGITPAQQVARVAQAAADAGHTQLAGLVPDTDFGHSLAQALQQEAASLSEPPPQIVFYDQGFSSVNDAVKNISDWDGRGAALMAQIKQAKDENTEAGLEKARELRRQQVAPPSFNALFIGATDGDTLAELANFLPYYDVSAPQVQLMGPAMWAPLATAMASQSALLGAIYAAPDPAAATSFQAKYSAAYGSTPPGIADIAFDAAALAKLAASSGGYTAQVLTAPSGFTGTDGLIVLQPDGTVKRGLAVFSIAPGQPSISSPAPASLSQP